MWLPPAFFVQCAATRFPNFSYTFQAIDCIHIEKEHFRPVTMTYDLDIQTRPKIQDNVKVIQRSSSSKVTVQIHTDTHNHGPTAAPRPLKRSVNMCRCRSGITKRNDSATDMASENYILECTVYTRRFLTAEPAAKNERASVTEHRSSPEAPMAWAHLRQSRRHLALTSHDKWTHANTHNSQPQLYMGWSDVTESMVNIRSPFCGYNTI